jgi:hypothetical protein
MRRIAYLVAAACLLAGCGVLTKQDLKPQVPTLSHGRFVYLANRACARNERRQKRISRRHAKSAVALDKELHTSLNTGERLLFILRGLTPPPADTADFRRLLATANDEVLVETHLLQAFEEGQARVVRTRLKRLRALDRRFDARSAKLGLTICAKP